MHYKHIEKNELCFTKVSNDLGMVVYFCSLGASIYQININRYVMTRNVYDLENFKDPKMYYGKTIGRISNRFKGHELKLNGEIYKITPNEGENILHGGIHGLSCKVFDVEVNKEDEYIDVIYFTKLYQEEDEFPGDLDIKVIYRIYRNRNEIDVSYIASGNKNTVISLTNHTYFTLGSRSLKGLSLKINSNKYLSTDENLLAKEETEVTEALDFSSGKEILKDIDSEELHSDRLNGYDHFFYFNNKNINEKNVTLYNDKFELSIYTNFEGVQIYTSGHKCPYDLYPYYDKEFDSVAIEPSDSFKNLRLLKEGTTYKRKIKYLFNSKE